MVDLFLNFIKMPHPCVVCGRSRMNPNNRVEEYIFFGFPVNDEVRCKKWLEFCCREELYKLTKKQLLQRMICSKHFVSSDFVNDFYDRLNNTAVPSIYDPKQSLYNISCVLCGRFRKDPPGLENDGATFHHFPGEEFRCLKWLDFVGVDSYYRLTRKEIMFCFICSKHFDRDQFILGFHNRLIDTAVPNIRNPDNENIQWKLEDKDDESIMTDVELFNFCDKGEKRINPLPVAVLESQACAACGRLKADPRNKSQKYKFHPFPAYEIGRCLKWCQFLGREDILKMSPNQIRRLVLCSGHFQAGQNFNNGNGPCDAVPTIYNCKSNNEIIKKSNVSVDLGDANKIVRPSVSSKKPKMDPKYKPAPLAKKRGKSKRPTRITIPKIDSRMNNFPVKKLPILTANKWKLISNQFQPMTISNNILTNVAPNIKKVILPFSGNISDLGAPILVDSLSSIPPGLLIKIDLPESEKTVDKTARKKIRRKVVEQQPQTIPFEYIEVQNTLKCGNEQSEIIECVPDNDMAEDIDEQFINDESFNNFNEIGEENYIEKIQKNGYVEETKPKIKMSAKCRRTLIPIQCEIKQFLNRLKPHVKRLPKKTKAKVKLAIVNMVIDQL
ncbi:uncharacterized protein LOC131673969 [Phymastichus coffea]|uniref:uncharacterized protein LOC131673969 n=1 Tax=Phymastichus coffea TaxID=108790 RepID=UPI00273C1B4B|nr:uncharacterized protein LOC131673969 [Phymastichus coffea]